MRRFWSKFAVAGALLSAICMNVASAEPKPIPPEQFESLKKRIQPQPGENRFWEIPWLVSIHEARVKAAAEGKPIYVWSGSQGAPITGC
ncbi:MAG: hypothetical protein WD066_03010 [Planctomycetaceae bacterium]